MRRSGFYRVYRGSGWLNDPRYARGAFRHGDVDPAARRRGLGVRLVEEEDGPTPDPRGVPTPTPPPPEVPE
jgi:hypothetical protein